MQESIISQSNVLTTSRIEYTALERNIFYMILKQLSKKPEKYYYISIRELAEKTGVDNSYKNYRDATEKLLTRTYSFKRPENGNLLQVSMFSSCEYMDDQGRIEITIDDKLKPYLFDLKNNFTTLQLEVALKLNSKYSKRLYEILRQWKDHPTKTFELLELKRMLNLYNPDTGEEKYKNWSDFENKVLKVARKELKKLKGDISFNYKPNKIGRKYSSITFTIEQESYQKTIDFEDEETQVLSRLVNQYGLRRDQAEHVLTKYSINEIRRLLYQINLEKNSNNIRNLGGYTAKIFNVK